MPSGYAAANPLVRTTSSYDSTNMPYAIQQHRSKFGTKQPKVLYRLSESEEYTWKIRRKSNFINVLKSTLSNFLLPYPKEYIELRGFISGTILKDVQYDLDDPLGVVGSVSELAGFKILLLDWPVELSTLVSDKLKDRNKDPTVPNNRINCYVEGDESWEEGSYINYASTIANQEAAKGSSDAAWYQFYSSDVQNDDVNHQHVRMREENWSSFVAKVTNPKRLDMWILEKLVPFQHKFSISPSNKPRTRVAITYRRYSEFVVVQARSSSSIKSGSYSTKLLNPGSNSPPIMFTECYNGSNEEAHMQLGERIEHLDHVRMLEDAFSDKTSTSVQYAGLKRQGSMSNSLDVEIIAQLHDDIIYDYVIHFRKIEIEGQDLHSSPEGNSKSNGEGTLSHGSNLRDSSSSMRYTYAYVREELLEETD